MKNKNEEQFIDALVYLEKTSENLKDSYHAIKSIEKDIKRHKDRADYFESQNIIADRKIKDLEDTVKNLRRTNAEQLEKRREDKITNKMSIAMIPDIPIRIKVILWQMDISFIHQVSYYSEADFLRQPRFGRRSLEKLKMAAKKHGYQVGVGFDAEELPKEKKFEDRPLNELNFMVRTSNCFHEEGLTMVSEIIDMSEKDMLRIPNFGRKSFHDVKSVLNEHGYKIFQSDH